jgi:photosystem II stability/assembly factor-like uncharacterized protein
MYGIYDSIKNSLFKFRINPHSGIGLSGIACSNDGKNIILTVYTGNGTYISNDYGDTWTNTTLVQTQQQSVTMSDDGKYISIITFRGRIIYSHDSGGSWNSSVVDIYSPLYKTIASSSNGEYVFVGSYNDKRFYISTDFGKTYKKSPHDHGTYSIRSLATSSSGKYVVISDISNVRVSKDYGINFNSYTIDNAITIVNINSTPVSISGNGKIIYAAFDNKGIYISKNFGDSWHIIRNDISMNWEL